MWCVVRCYLKVKVSQLLLNSSCPFSFFLHFSYSFFVLSGVLVTLIWSPGMLAHFHQVSEWSILNPLQVVMGRGYAGEGHGSPEESGRMTHSLWHPQWFRYLFLVWREQVLSRCVVRKFKSGKLLLLLLFYRMTCMFKTFAFLGLCRLQKEGKDCMGWLLQGTGSKGNLAF